ncbi:MAG: long-chain fatty acid--CoA ligase, partial [Prevotellaceae bacterium]|nr:long-chain fatty acid--CoA ligase [Prevotellaceae bacterium]
MQEIKTLQHMLQSSIALHADRSCFSFVGSQPMTYSMLGERVADTQRLLASHGVGVGDKVAILSHNMPNWGVAYMAVVSMGAVVVPLLPDFSRTEIENVLNHSDTKLVFMSERTLPKIDGLSIPRVEARVMLETLASPFLDDAQSRSQTPLPSYAVRPNDLAAIIYTSGTTGKNKGVMLTHHNLVSQVKMAYHLQPVEKEDVFLSILPLPHTYENS